MNYIKLGKLISLMGILISVFYFAPTLIKKGIGASDSMMFLYFIFFISIFALLYLFVRFIEFKIKK